MPGPNNGNNSTCTSVEFVAGSVAGGVCIFSKAISSLGFWILKKVDMFLDMAGLVSVGCGFIFQFHFFFI